MNEYLVVGIEFRTSKKGETYHMLHLSQTFSDIKYGVGSRTSVEYIPKKAFPSNLNVGDNVQLVYGRSFDGKAYVTGVHVVGEEIPAIKK